jgi:signal-transduction protein with cAMP-binding, CBS, and nucleotidyltransferase domain
MEVDLEKMTLKQLRNFERKFLIEKDKKINGLGVTKNGKPIGIITKYDIKTNYHSKTFERRNYSGSKKTKMTRCDICGEKIEGMPFTCRRCGGNIVAIIDYPSHTIAKD